MPAEFVHLHVHSQYSLLEGAIRVEDLCRRTAELGMNAVAMTDHGNLHGALDLHKRAKSAGLKPILGCEVAFEAPWSAAPSDGTAPPAHHLVLLARNAEGYKNLIALVSDAWLRVKDGESPRSSLASLSRWNKGLVVLTGCLGGLGPQSLLLRSREVARATLAQLRDVTEPGSLYFEMQDHGLPEQPLVNETLLPIARELGLPPVATNDAHYLHRDDWSAHKLLGCIATGRTLAQADRHDHGSHEMYLKSPTEMAERFRSVPEALANTLAIAESVQGVDPTCKPMLPRFRDEHGHEIADENAVFATRAREGLEKRFAQFVRRGIAVNAVQYTDRLAIEIDMIATMGFAGYFLIVSDFIAWAKNNGVPVGPGRGSGAGSLVAYALGITDLDPIPYNLLFERFLNPERVSMPDFDIDFCMLQRERVIEYVRNKYGKQSVGQIATFSMLKSKSVVRDVGRAMGVPLPEVDAIAKLIPEPVQGKSVSIDEALEKEPRLQGMYDEGGAARELLDHARKLENLNRHAGVHAAGIVISEGPLWNSVPVFRGAGGEMVTQYAKDEVEAAGLVKFDFLGLTTLTVIDTAVGLINRRPDWVERAARGEGFDVSVLPLDDKDTYALLQTGETTGVFQLESSGMQKLFRDLRPDRFEDIVAAVALYRPGPLGTDMVRDFVARKNGRAKTEYLHKDLKEVLEDTYGVITYQEQVMMIARIMGGYTLGGADLLRRAMGKKKAEEMAKQKSTFVAGARAKGYDEGEAGRIFDLLEHFAGYGFNKSHSAAYALITYQTAYLKTHYPVEFTTATLTADLGKIEKVVGTIAEGRSMGIAVLPPDVNESGKAFTVVYESTPVAVSKKAKTRVERDEWRPRIRFGLGGIKGVGEAAVEAIVEARGAGRFLDVFDFCARVDIRRVNRAVLEALVQSGAFDQTLEKTGATRAQGFAAIDAALERGRSVARERDSGQMGLFGASQALRPSAGYPAVEGWDGAEQLRRERASLGFYLSGHPLDRYAKETARVVTATTSGLADRRDGEEVCLAGVVEAYRERPTKTGGRMAFFELDDRHGRVEVIVRPKVFAELNDALDAAARQTMANTLFREGEAVLVTGKVTIERRYEEGGEGEDAVAEEALERKVSLFEVSALGAALTARARMVTLRLAEGMATEAKLAALKSALEGHPGKCPVEVLVRAGGVGEVTIGLPGSLRVDPSDALLAKMERVLGAKVAELR